MSKVEIAAQEPLVALTKLASSQYGLVTRKQASRCGFTSKQVLHRLSKRIWTQPFPGILMLGTGPLSRDARIQLARLLAGDGSASSHSTAAELWLLPGPREGKFHAVAPLSNRRKQPVGTYVLHWSRTFTERSVRVRNGHRVTSIERTFIDLAALWTEDQLERALENALERGLLTLKDLVAAISALRDSGRDGIGPLLKLLAARGATQVSTESELETRFVQFLRRHDLPAPTRQQQLGRLRVDFTWETARLVVEVDGRDFHSTRQDQTRDRLRQLELVAKGYRVISLAAEEILGKNTDAAASQLRRALGLMSQPSLPLVGRRTG